MYGPAIFAGAAACSSAHTLQLETGFYPRENTALGDKKIKTERKLLANNTSLMGKNTGGLFTFFTLDILKRN